MDNLLTKVWVKRHNTLVKAHQKTTLSLIAQKLLFFSFTLKEQDLDETLEFRVADFLGRAPGGKDIKNIDQACDELSSAKVRQGSGINDADYEANDFNRKYIALFDTIEINKTKVSFKFNRTFKSFLGPTSNYTLYLFGNLKDIRSPHAVRLYDYLIGGVGKYTERLVELNELKSILGVADRKSYNVFNTFKNSVLEPAVNGIDEHSDIHLSYTPVRKSGRKYTHILFKFRKKIIIAKDTTANTDGGEEALNAVNRQKIASMRDLKLPENIIEATINVLLKEQSEVIDITAHQMEIPQMENAPMGSSQNETAKTPAGKFVPVVIECPQYGNDKQLFAELSSKLAKKLNYFGEYDFSTKKYGEWHQVYVEVLNEELSFFFKEMKAVGIGNKVIDMALKDFVATLENDQILRPLRKELKDLKNAIRNNEMFPNRNSFNKMIREWGE
ncbi:replication initiation protein [Flammeovirga aprica]|uniref:Replication initiation protein n=1 Tax=Flammeovirga aprica JL-4 TaxID=694437 RepID=A0A7X9RXF0_9BACT|nr:replication initiation protein [Flammeovirga aprica]NME70548.1 replication initiation protein [Flammeovirga aprica JL-4]